MDLGEDGAVVRYYENITDNYRRDIAPVENGEVVGCFKLNLIKEVSLCFTALVRKTPERSRNYKKKRGLEGDEYAEGCASVLEELF